MSRCVLCAFGFRSDYMYILPVELVVVKSARTHTHTNTTVIAFGPFLRVAVTFRFRSVGVSNIIVY